MASATLSRSSLIVLSVNRCHINFINRFNFVPLLLACLVRSSMEMVIALQHQLVPSVWPCTTTILVWSLLAVPLQIILCLLATLLFQNLFLIILANKVYLSKSYTAILHAMNRSKQMQTCLSFVLPIACWSMVLAYYHYYGYHFDDGEVNGMDITTTTTLASGHQHHNTINPSYEYAGPNSESGPANGGGGGGPNNINNSASWLALLPIIQIITVNIIILI